MALGSFDNGRQSFANKIRQQQLKGNNAKVKNLTARYRARVMLSNPLRDNGTPFTSVPKLKRQLRKYAPGAARKFARKYQPPGTPGGTV